MTKNTVKALLGLLLDYVIRASALKDLLQEGDCFLVGAALAAKLLFSALKDFLQEVDCFFVELL